MIGLKVNDTFLQLQRDAKISLEYINHVFDDEVISGEYSLPFDFPYSGNGSKLDFVYELLVKNRIKKYDIAAWYFKRIKMHSGILDILKVNKKSVAASLRLNISGLTCIEKKLTEIDMGTFSMGASQADIRGKARTLAADIWPVYPIQFPTIFNPNFYGEDNEKNPDYEGWMNNYDFDNDEYLANSGGLNKNTLVPMVYLMHVLEKGFASDDYTISGGDFYTDTQMRNLMLYGNRAIDKRAGTNSTGGLRVSIYSSQEIDQSGAQDVIFDDETTGDNYDDLGIYDNSTGQYTIHAAGPVTVYTEISWEYGNWAAGSTDTVTVSLVLNGTVLHSVSNVNNHGGGHGGGGVLSFTHLFTAVSGDVGHILSVQVTYSNSANSSLTIEVVPESIFRVNDFSNFTGHNNFYDVITIKDHCPDITFGALLNDLRKQFNLVYTFNHEKKTVTINFYDTIRNGGSTNLDGKYIPGHEIIAVEHSIKDFDWQWPSDDGFTEDNFKTFKEEFHLGEYTVLTDLPTASVTYLGRYATILETKNVMVCEEISSGSGTYHWVYYTDAYYLKTVDRYGHIQIRPEIAPIMMTYGYANFPFPKILQQGTSNEFNLGENLCSARLFYFYGRTETSYPFATSQSWRYDGTFLNSYGLNYTEERSVYNLWTTHIDDRAKNEIVQFNVRLNTIDLRKFDVTGKLNFAHSYFIIHDMKIDVGEILDEAVYRLIQL